MSTDLMLSALDEADLSSYEEVIANGLQTFREVGTALAQIRNRKLYRQTHVTFEAYCEQQWQMSRPRAYELMQAAGLVNALSAIADTPVPSNEGQARSLSGLEPEVAAEVMTATADAGKVTAKSITDHRRLIAPESMPVAKVTETTKTETYVNTDTGEVVEPVKPSPVDAYLANDAELQDKNYITNFTASMTKSDDLLGFDAERVGRLVTNSHMVSLDHLVDSITAFRDRAKRARSGLRLVNGSAK